MLIARKNEHTPARWTQRVHVFLKGEDDVQNDFLVPLDGTVRSEAALPLAARIARNAQATLVLVKVVSFVSEYWMPITPTYPIMAQTAIDADVEEATAYLERIAADPKLAGITIKTSVQCGQVAPTILAVAASFGGDLIVLCHHGSTGALHWIMGSVAEMVARHAAIPVLVLREGATSLGGTAADSAQPLRLLVPLDGSAGAQAALEPGAELLTALAAPRQKTALHLARVIPPVEGKYGDLGELLYTSSELSRAKHFLRQTTALLREGSLAPTIAHQHMPVTWSVLVDSDVSDALVRLAEQGEETEGAGVFGGCELLTIATHGRAGVQRWVMGSIAERMLAATMRPILIVHPQSQTTWKTLKELGEVPVALN